MASMQPAQWRCSTDTGFVGAIAGAWRVDDALQRAHVAASDHSCAFACDPIVGSVLMTPLLIATLCAATVGTRQLPVECASTPRSSSPLHQNWQS
jgi:hypothetical protein